MAESKPEDVFGALLTSLECPVCLEYVQPPVKQCGNGHCICSLCLDKLIEMANTCPVCKVNIEIPARSLIADTFVTKIMFPCKYSKDGCKEKQLLHDLVEHHKKCGYFCYCNIDDCSWRGALSSYMAHVDGVHEGCSSREEYTTLCFKLPVQPNQHVTIIEAHEKIFESRFTYDDDGDLSTLYGSVRCLGPRNDESSFEYQVEFRSPSGEYHLIFQQVASYEESDVDQLVLCHRMLDVFYLEGNDKLISFSLRIIKN